MASPQTLEPIAKVLSTHPTFRPNVSPAIGTLDNGPFSRIHHVVVCSATGPLYDLPAVAEPQGAIALTVNRRGQVALLRHFRPVPPARAGSAPFHAPLGVRHGFYSTEVPRGFPRDGERAADAARREVAEEVGLHVVRVARLGWCNVNTAWALTDLPVFAVLVDEQRPAQGHNDDGDDDAEDEAEVIERVEWVDVAEVRKRVAKGEIRCGLTLAALAFALADWEAVEEFVRAGRDAEAVSDGKRREGT